jgi:uncharacterized protein DUF4349
MIATIDGTGMRGRRPRRARPIKGFDLLGLVGLVMLLALTGCDKPSAVPPAPMAAPAPQPPLATAAVAARNIKLAYSHEMRLDMPAASVEARYDRAIKKCLDEAKFNCVVLNTSFGTAELTGAPHPSAALTVRLAHDAVAPFEADLLAPLPGEAANDAVLRSRSTTADDLTAAIADVERRQAQLADYRDRLIELSKRPDVKVEDLIKIESELSNTQSQLETIAAQKKTLDQRVDTERLTIYLNTRDENGGFFGPVVQAWDQAGRVLGDNAGAAIRFSIGILPWLPIVLLGLFLVRLIFRLWRR